MPGFDAQVELAKLKTQSALLHKKRYRRSRLTRFKGELLTLHQGGATIAELKRWLATKDVIVAHSTVARWLRQYG